MNSASPLGTPVRQAKLALSSMSSQSSSSSSSSCKSPQLTNEWKKLFHEQHQRLWTKHQQDMDLLDDIKSYVKSRLSIERDYCSSLMKLSKQHSNLISKKFTIIENCKSNNLEYNNSNCSKNVNSVSVKSSRKSTDAETKASSRNTSNLTNNNNNNVDAYDHSHSLEEPCTLYKTWLEHINKLNSTSKYRSEQFEQLLMIVDKVKDIRNHKANIGKKCLDNYLRKVHENLLQSIADVEKTRKLYYEDESQAKKARENEEKIKKKRSGLLTKFTDLQAKKEKSMAQREANDIQSTQARNDYIMALAAGNAHIDYYYERDLTEFISCIDDGVLDHCKIFMATLSECELNSQKDSLKTAQTFSKMINLTSSQKTNSIFINSPQSACLQKNKSNLPFEPCNDDPINTISLEHNADYALQHEIDKWLTWFKKECRNLSQLMHQLDTCQRAFAEGKKTIELNGQTSEDLESKILELKQLITRSEAAKLKAQARLCVIKEGGMQIEEWSSIEVEIRADAARALEIAKMRRNQEQLTRNQTARIDEVVDDYDDQDVDGNDDDDDLDTANNTNHSQAQQFSDKQQAVSKAMSANYGQSAFVFDQTKTDQVLLQVSRDSEASDDGDSMHQFASVSRSTSNLQQKHQNVVSSYSAFTDPSIAWQDDFNSAWSSQTPLKDADLHSPASIKIGANSNETSTTVKLNQHQQDNLLNTSAIDHGQHSKTSMTIQSSSPLSAIVDGVQNSPSPNQQSIADAYKSDFECDYNRNSVQLRSVDQNVQQKLMPQGFDTNFSFSQDLAAQQQQFASFEGQEGYDDDDGVDHSIVENVSTYLNKRVVALYSFERKNTDELAFDQDDILTIVEADDPNWIKARNDTTLEEGYIPSAYVKLYDESGVDSSAKEQDFNELKQNINSNSYGKLNINEENNNISKQEFPDNCLEESTYFCRALYDYVHESNTDEAEDGLPFLDLKQREVFRIIDKDSEDGWWLVERDHDGVRGHAPSMLFEELEPGEEIEEDEKADDEDDDCDASEIEDFDTPIKQMPSIAAPVLNQDDEMHLPEDESSRHMEEDEKIEELTDPGKTKKTSSSLVPMSFIIIEPTPEVESKNSNEIFDEHKVDGNDCTKEQSQSDRNIIQSASEPPSDVSYSVVNEDFVLGRPCRQPNTFEIQQPSTDSGANKTLYEEEEEVEKDGNDAERMHSVSNANISQDNESGFEFPPPPPPPSVVVDACEDPKRLDYGCDDEYDYDNDQRDYEEYSGSNQEQNKRENQVGRGYDIDPILRCQADEFCKQLITEAMERVQVCGLDENNSTDPEMLDELM